MFKERVRGSGGIAMERVVVGAGKVSSEYKAVIMKPTYY